MTTHSAHNDRPDVIISDVGLRLSVVRRAGSRTWTATVSLAGETVFTHVVDAADTTAAAVADAAQRAFARRLAQTLAST